VTRYIKSGTVNTVQEINSELERIQAAQVEFLARDGQAPNAMTAPLDMNNQRLINLPPPASPTDPVRSIDLPNFIAEDNTLLLITREESIVLTAGQTVVTLTELTTTQTAYYVSGQSVDQGRLISNTDYVVTSTTQITLIESYPVGTRLTAVQNEGVEALVSDVQTFNDIAEMKQATLGVGNTALCKRYYAGDALVDGLLFNIVAGSTGTDDGGSFHDLANGNQAELVINRTINVLQFGAVRDKSVSVSIPVQAAITLAESFEGCVYFPRGEYLFSTPVFTAEEIVQFTVDTTQALKLYGDGKGTKFYGQGATPAVYVNGVNDGSDSILRIHKSNVIIEGIQFREAPVALYIGQSVTSLIRSSHTNFIQGTNLWWQRCGTCILNQPGKTNYNNHFRNMHMQGFQIGIHNGLPFHHNDVAQNTDLDVSNRNTYETFSLNNGWVGLLIENGDTNNIDNSTFESINGDPARIGAIGSAPVQLLDGIATAIYSNQDTHAYGVNTWKLSNIEAEANDRDLYLDGSGWAFSNTFMDSTIIELGASGAVPKWTSTDSPSVQGKYGNHHFGGLHIKTSIGVTDPFNPTAGITADDRGAYFDGGRVSDTGGRRSTYDLTSNADIDSIEAGTTKYWSLGGVIEWFGFVTFTKNAGLGTNDALRLVLPNTAQIDTVFNGQKMTCYAQSTLSARELVELTFLASNNQIDISAPVNGWSTNSNRIYFNIRWFNL
jgi:hypothetical protein